MRVQAATLTPELLHNMSACWRAATCSSVGQIYLKDELNFTYVSDDVEGEAGPVAMASHFNKMLDPPTEGAVQPIREALGLAVEQNSEVGKLDFVRKEISSDLAALARLTVKRPEVGKTAMFVAGLKRRIATVLVRPLGPGAMEAEIEPAVIARAIHLSFGATMWLSFVPVIASALRSRTVKL